MFVTVQKTSWGGSNKFEDSSIENTKLSAFQMVGSSLFHSMIADGKKDFFCEKVLLSFDQRNTINNFRSIRRRFFRYHFKKFQGTFVLINFVKHC